MISIPQSDLNQDEKLVLATHLNFVRKLREQNHGSPIISSRFRRTGKTLALRGYIERHRGTVSCVQLIGRADERHFMNLPNSQGSPVAPPTLPLGEGETAEPSSDKHLAKDALKEVVHLGLGEHADHSNPAL